MVKIRLRGTPEEVEKALGYIEKKAETDELKILSASNVYPDRGKSVYVKVYLDVELKEA